MQIDISAHLFEDISQLIEAAKNRVAHYANSTLVLLYWQIGQRIRHEVLKDERAEYGERIINQLAQAVISN